MQSYEILFLRASEMGDYFASGKLPEYSASLSVTSQQAANVFEIPAVGDLVNFNRDGVEIAGTVQKRLFVYGDKSSRGQQVSLSVQVLIFVQDGEE